MLRLSWVDPLVIDAELDPPDRESAQPAERLGRKRRPIVASDRVWQAVLAEQSVELPQRGILLDRSQTMAAQDEARVGVADRERVAQLAVAHPKLTFVVRGPDLVGRMRHEWRRAGMLRRAALAARLREPVAGQDRRGRADGGPGHTVVAAREVPEQLPGAPRRVRSAGLDKQPLGLSRCLGMLGEASTALVGERLGPAIAVALDLLVGRRSGDAEACGEFGDGVEAVEIGGDETGALHRRVGGGEGHGVQGGCPV